MSARKLMLVVGEDGYGKRFATKELKAKGRGTMGVKVGEGPLAAAWMVRDSDELIVATRQGQMIRLSAKRCAGLSPQGARGAGGARPRGRSGRRSGARQGSREGLVCLGVRDFRDLTAIEGRTRPEPPRRGSAPSDRLHSRGRGQPRPGRGHVCASAPRDRSLDPIGATEEDCESPTVPIRGG